MIWLATLLALQDPIKDYRRAAAPEDRIAAVAKMRDTDTIVRVAAWDPDVSVRAAALDALAEKLADHDVRDLALRILFAPFEARSTPDAALRDARRGAGDVPAMRAKVHRMLVAKPHEAMLAILRDVLAGHTRQIASFVRSREGDSLTLHRCAAAEALGVAASEKDVAALTAALADPEPRVRSAAARALGCGGAAYLRKHATHDEPDADVRFEARRAIERVESADVEVAFVFEPGRAATRKKIRAIATSLESRDVALRVALVPIRDGEAMSGLSSDRDAALAQLDTLRVGPRRVTPDAAIADAVCRLNWSRGSRKHLFVFVETAPASAELVRQVLRSFVRGDGAKATLFHAPGDTSASDLAKQSGAEAEEFGSGPAAFDANVSQRIVMHSPEAARAADALSKVPGVSDVSCLNDLITLSYKGLWSGLRALEGAGAVASTLSDPIRHRVRLESAPTAEQVSNLELKTGMRKLVGAGGDAYDVFTDSRISLDDVRAALTGAGIRLRKN